MHPKYSITAGINMDQTSLGGFLCSYFNGNRISSHISRVYIDNPFRLLLDSPEERKDAEKSLETLAKTIIGAELEPVFVFDYTCLGDHHLTAAFQKKFGRLLGFLDSVGVKSISVSDLYLAETFSSGHSPYDNFKHFRVYISRKARINHAIKLKYIENINYSAITLHPDLNRNFEEIIRALSFTGKHKIEVVLNSGCFEGCPLEIFCNALQFHLAEEEASGDEEKPVSYYTDKCSGWIETDPSWTYRLPIILPERIGDYINAGTEYFQILNNPDSLSDLKTKLTSYLERKSPSDPALLIYGRETILAGRWESDVSQARTNLKAAAKTAEAMARFIES